MKRNTPKSNPNGESDKSKTFKEIYLVIDNKFNIVEGNESLIRNLYGRAGKGDSKQFFLLFSNSNKKKLKSLILQVIKDKVYQQTESRIKFNNQSLLCSIDIIPKGNSALILIKDITRKKDLVNRLKKSQKQLRDLANHLQNIREEERHHFAREIHDDLGQKLTALQIEMGLILRKLKSNRSEISSNQLYKKLQSVNKLINDTLDSKKLLLTKFRLDYLKEFGLVESIRHFLEEFQSRYNIEYYFYSDWKNLELEYNKCVAFYRIFQEALTNVAKHAGATKVDISIEERDNKILMTIEDNGIGITKKNIEKTDGFGLIGMEERIQLIGGTFSIKGKPAKGTKLQVSTKLK